MPDTSRNTPDSNKLPQITSLSIAFPLTFESSAQSNIDPRRASKAQSEAERPPHRHDAGE